ncbi:tetratricopeptide repeat-containing sensor histidine kinase [Fulvivirga lutea]|uniref:histidine kinase n=1 Tax=Fulvivirga lutea TaxID=2810512 RepID=A0A974WGU2_9BACT|nr:tetratricopeptide repeat protein [Fulvivirga lutea]QSE98263.1 tetratricopeptide repeat-containing sensor histidine kinase [Fulvivirga lutea]
MQRIINWLLTCVLLAVTCQGISQNRLVIDSLKNKLDTSETTQKIGAFNQLGWQYRKMYPDSSIYFLESALELMELVGSFELQPETYNFLGVAYLYKGDYLVSYDYHEKAKDTAFENKDSLQYGHALNSLGRLYEGTAAYDKAIEYYNEALSIFQKLDDRIGLAYIYSSLATFYQSQKSYIKAEEMSKRALKIRLDEELWAGAAFSYLELAKIYADAGKDEEALETISRAKQYSDSVQANLVLKAEVNTEIARQYRHRNRLDEAEGLMKTAKKLAEGISNQNLFMKVYNEYGQLKYALGDYNEAITYHKKVVNAAEKSAFWSELKDAYYHLSKNYESLGNLKLAFENFKKYNEIEIKFLDTEKARLVQQHESRIALETRARENELLKIEKQKNEALLSEQKIRNIALVALITVMLVLLITFMFYSFKRKKANAILTKQKDQLADINLQKDTLMNVLAHDLKAPFNRIGGLVDLMKADKGNEEQYIGMIDEISHGGIQLIKNILEINKLESGETKDYIAKVDVQELINQKAHNYGEDAKLKGIKLSMNVEVDRLFTTNEVFLERIIDNLISNAIKYSRSDKEVQVSVKVDDSKLIFSVEDQGPGFTEEDKKMLYTKFKTLSAKPTAGEASNGLGLSLVKSLVNKLNGTITLDSELGKGSKFEVIIPELT